MTNTWTIQQKVIVFFASGCGVGFIKGAPGTYGTLVALPLYWLLRGETFPLSYALIVLILALIGVPLCTHADRTFQTQDNSKIVFDEIVGYLITMLWIPLSLETAAIGFILFRLLDIVKPPPISTLEKRLPGGLGVMADDIAAGLFANIFLRLILHIFDSDSLALAANGSMFP